MLKVIIDTNLWISFLIGKRLQDLRKLCADEELLIISCDRIVEEFLDVSSREGLQKYIRQEDVSDTLELIRRFSVNVDIENIDVPGLKDPKDSFLFALAKETDANFILTGDKHLLKLRQYDNAVIISYSEFMKLHYSQSP